MACLKDPRFPLLVALGILIVVGVLPTTRWVLLNWIDYAKYGQYPEPTPEMKFIGPVAPKNLALVTYLPDRPEFEAAKLWGGSDAEGALAYARRVRTPIAFAQAVRVNRAGGLSDSDQKMKRDRHRELGPFIALRAASAEGAAIEPDNAFFLWNLAVADWILGYPLQAKQVMLKLKSCSRYEDYNLTSAQTIENAFASAFGYRGETVRIVNAAGLTFPHLARYRNMVRQMFSQQQSPEFRLEVMQASAQMAEQGHTAIDMLVAMAISRTALAPAGDKLIGLKNRDQHYQLLAQELQAQLDHSGVKTGELGPLAIELRRNVLVRSIQDLVAADVERESPFRADLPSLESRSLIVGFCLLVVASIVALILKALPIGQRTAVKPYLLGGVGLAYAAFVSEGSAPLLFPWLAALTCASAAVSILKPGSPSAVWFLSAVVLATVLASFRDPTFVLPAVLFVGDWLLDTKSDDKGRLLGLGILAGTALAFLAPLILHGDQRSWMTAFGFAVGSALSLAIVAKGWKVLSWATLTYVFMGLIFVGVELRLNEQLKGFANEFLTEGERIRAATSNRA